MSYNLTPLNLTNLDLSPLLRAFMFLISLHIRITAMCHEFKYDTNIKLFPITIPNNRISQKKF